MNDVLIFMTSPTLLQDGCTALMLAIRFRHASIVKLILDSEIIYDPDSVSIVLVLHVASEFTFCIRKYVGGRGRGRGRGRGTDDRTN